MNIHVYAPQLATPTVETTGQANSAVGVTADVYAYNGVDPNLFGNTPIANGFTGINSADITTGGSTVYTGGAIGNTHAGNATPAGAYNYNIGSDYTVQLYAAAGANQPLTALQPVSQYVSTLTTSAILGGTFMPFITFPDPGIPGTGINISTASATIALYVWYNGGAGLTLAQAQADGDPWGVSPLDYINNLGNTFMNGNDNNPPNTPSDLQGLQSFSLIVVPEPGTTALGVIGASALLFRRRKA